MPVPTRPVWEESTHCSLCLQDRGHRKLHVQHRVHLAGCPHKRVPSQLQMEPTSASVQKGQVSQRAVRAVTAAGESSFLCPLKFGGKAKLGCICPPRFSSQTKVLPAWLSERQKQLRRHELGWDMGMAAACPVLGSERDGEKLTLGLSCCVAGGCNLPGTIRSRRPAAGMAVSAAPGGFL